MSIEYLTFFPLFNQIKIDILKTEVCLSFKRKMKMKQKSESIFPITMSIPFKKQKTRSTENGKLLNNLQFK